MGVRAGPGWGEELHRQDELLAWHRLELWPRRPTHHDNVPHPEHPRDPQRHRQHLLPHSVRASATGFNPLPSVQPFVPASSPDRTVSPLPHLLLGLLDPLLGHLTLPSQLTHWAKFRPAHPVTVHQGGTQDEGAPEAEVRTRGGRCLLFHQGVYPFVQPILSTSGLCHLFLRY